MRKRIESRGFLRHALRLALILIWLTAAQATAPAGSGEGPTSAPRPIHLRSASLAGPTAEAGLPAHLLRDPATLETKGGPALVRLKSTVSTEARTALREAGAEIAGVIDRETLLVRLAPRSLSRPSLNEVVDWSLPFHPGLKLAPAVADIDSLDPRERIPITVHLFPEVDAYEMARTLTGMGLQVASVMNGRPLSNNDKESHRPGRIVILPSPAKIQETRESLAQSDDVMWIGLRPVYRLLNDGSSWVGQSGLDGGQSNPIHDAGLLGAGQTVGVLDTGLDADMCFFRDEVLGLPQTNRGFGPGTPDPNHRKVTIVNFLWDLDMPSDPTHWDDQGHGTHVAGSAVGDNFATPGVRDASDGMAPAAKLVMQDGGFGTDDCADMPALGCPAADLYPFFEQAWLQGAQIHSNSYGDRENFTPYNIYSEGSEAADAFMWDHPEFLLVFAAGNNGAVASVSSPATAKNVLAVGATEPGGAAGNLASFSSQGQTHDGRIKPDVTAPGSGIVSAGNDGNAGTNNCGTSVKSGTSMAAPTAAGLAALVREYYSTGWYPDGELDAADAFAPSAALIKATLIASARAMESVAAPPPSDPQGWGRITLDDALYLRHDARRMWVVDETTGFVSTADPDDLHTIEVIDSTQPLRVVLTWTDYPSTPVATINLVNDLDLVLHSPTGTAYRGNVLSGGESQPGGTSDTLNNVEVVNLSSPEPGTWTVRVHASAITQPSQAYALVAAGRMPAAGIALERTTLTVDDGVGGNGDGLADPGEWIDLPLGLLNSGDTAATNVVVSASIIEGAADVIQGTAPVGGLVPNEQKNTPAPHLRIRLHVGQPCTESVVLRLTYTADGFSRSEDISIPIPPGASVVADDFEGATGWQHIAGESTASSGNWTTGDPDGTGFQPEDDATPGPGTSCLFTAPNGGGVGTDDVDNGVVVARSGNFDLSGHPEARLTVSRWFANRDQGEDAGDFYRLEIRETSLAPDVLLEELGTNQSAPTWTKVTFRVADFVTPGPDIELKVSAADGAATGNIIEAALDDILFWDPACTTWDPVPNAVDNLLLDRIGNDVRLLWSRPTLDPAHGETASYKVFRAETLPGGFAQQVVLPDPATEISWDDPGAATTGTLLIWSVVGGNAAGDSELLP